jgi:hypothetical protein
MNRFKLRKSGFAIAATLLFSLFAVSAQAGTISDTERQTTITLTVDDIITENLDQNWGTLNIAAVGAPGGYDFTTGDNIALSVYDNDGFFSDTQLWSLDHQVTSAEASAGLVDLTFDVSWLAGAAGTSLDVYASARVDKDENTWWWGDDTPETGTLAVTVEAPSAVPIPAAAWLFGSAILGLLGIARRKKA